MKKNYPYLNDMHFLTQVINSSNLEYYVNVIMLNWDEQPIKDLQGKVTTANINIDGNSSVRRTANVSFIVNEEDEDSTSLLTLNKKIYLEIGYLNEIDNDKYNTFPIIWFPLGLYIITDISFSHNLNGGVSVSLGLKDKMCLLNGECGGMLPAATVFDNCEVYSEDGTILIKRPTIDQIIMELVNHFGGEQLGKIIISDLDKRIRQAITWTGNVPIYVLNNGTNNSYLYTIDQADAVAKIQSGNYTNVQGSPFEAGSNVGFILTDFTYPGDLIGNPGDTIVTILDKIKNTLGNFEYFYDLYGNFRFQEIKNYLNNAQSKYILESLQHGQLVPQYLSAGEAYLIQRTNGKAVFSFKENKNLVISYSNTPKIGSIKNDFIIWGIRKTASGQQFPIRYHLAIDNKPSIGRKYKVFKYVDLYDENIQRWYKPLQYSSRSAFPEKGLDGVFYYDQSKIYQWKTVDGLSQYIQIPANITQITVKDWRTQLYFQGVSAQPYGIDSNYYYTELLAEWPKIYDIENGHFKQEFLKSGTGLDFYLDFINPNTKQSQKICVNNIGRRSIVINKNEDVNCVFQPYIPDVILIHNNFTSGNSTIETDMKKLRDECNARGLNYTQISDSIYNFLVPTAGLNSGYEEVRQSLHQYINFSENITLQTLPVYFLQPNTCIEVEDKDSFIEGNYIINSLSFSLDVSSTLSINASKIISKI